MVFKNQNPTLPARFFLTDQERRPDPMPSIAGLAKGTGVIFRHYKTPGREGLAKKVAVLCREKNLVLLVAGDPALAKKINASGIHLPSWALNSPPPDLNPDWLISASAHNLPEIRAGEKAGASVLLLGPVFKTKSHPDRKTLGLKGFHNLARKTSLYVYAIGGVAEENFKTLFGPVNLAGFAGISNFKG